MQQVENELEEGVRAALANDTTLAALATHGIWNGAADEGTGCPFVTFRQQTAGMHDYVFGDRRVKTEYRVAVKGVTEGLATLLAGRIDRAIDNALTASKLTVSGYSVLLCRRVSDIDYPEDDQGRNFRHRGGLYAIELTS